MKGTEIFNQVSVTADRVEAMVRRLFALKGRGFIKGIEPGMQIGIDAACGRYADLQAPSSVYPFVVTDLRGAAAGQRGVYLLFNPVGSGMVVTVDGAEGNVVTSLTGSPQWFSTRGSVGGGGFTWNAIATDFRLGANQDRFRVPGVQLVGDSVAAATTYSAWAGGTSVFPMEAQLGFPVVAGGARQDFPLRWAPVVLGPGQGLGWDVSQVITNSTTEFTAWGTARPALANELSLGM